jgi:SAM-dependent methyltransferase
MQTLELARLSGGVVAAVDNHRSFLEELNRRARAAEIPDQVKTVQADMGALPFAPGSLDLLWSEGAIYIMGFEAGLRAWRPLLRPNGHIAVTEAAWIKEDPPEPLARFWAEGYPAMTTRQGNVRIAESCGYRVLDHFALPAEAWWTHYYTPMEERLPELRRRHAEDPDALAALDEEAKELDLHRDHGDYYGYVFYVLQRRKTP